MGEEGYGGGYDAGGEVVGIVGEKVAGRGPLGELFRVREYSLNFGVYYFFVFEGCFDLVVRGASRVIGAISVGILYVIPYFLPRLSLQSLDRL